MITALHVCFYLNNMEKQIEDAHNAGDFSLLFK